MTKNAAIELIQRYYDSFNRQDWDAFFDLLDEQVVHDINQGQVETGKLEFQQFMARMNACYQEKIKDIVIMVNDDGSRGATEFVVDGCYIQTDPGLPEASGQEYSLKGGAFFDIDRGKIARVTNYYNLNEWLKQIE